MREREIERRLGEKTHNWNKRVEEFRSSGNMTKDMIAAADRMFSQFMERGQVKRCNFLKMKERIRLWA